MAVLGGPGLNGRAEPADPPHWAPATGGALGSLARAQYAALAEMRWHAFRNGVRSTRGALEAAANGLAYVLWGVMGLGIAAGMGTGAYFMVSKGMWPILSILLWVVFLIWQTMPIGVASFQQQFDLNGLLRFPLGFAPFFMLHVLFGLIDPASFLGGLACLGIGAGITLAHPQAAIWAVLGLAAFGAFNVLLSRAIFAWLDRWLAQRRTREILSALFLIAMLSLQLLNPALHHRRHSGKIGHAERLAAEKQLAAAGAVQNWLPPGLAVLTVEQAAQGHPAAGLESLGLLGLYGLSAALTLGVRLRAEHRGESLSSAPRARKPEKRSRAAPDAIAATSAPASLLGPASLRTPSPFPAIIWKDARIVMRALPLLYAIAAPTFLVLIFAGVFRSSGRHAVPMAVPLCIVYALLGFTQLIYNSLGTEGPAIQLLFLSPTPIRTVILAKNVFHALLFGLIAVLAGALASLRAGPPTAAWLAATAAWLAFALPAHLAAGNIFSLTMPHRIRMDRIGRQRGAQASALLALAVQLAVVAVGAAVIAPCAFFGRMWLATPILFALAIPALLVWLRTLANAEAMANRRREELIAVLAKVD